MQSNIKCKIISLNVRGIRDQPKGGACLLIWKIRKPIFIFSKRRVQMQMMNQCGKVNWGGGGKILFSHGKHHIKSVCILFDPTVNSNVECFFSNNTGRIVLISTYLNGVKTSLCNIYAPNNQSDQLEFIQELNNCIVDKSEMTNIIIGGDWNCTLTKKDKKGGAFWKPTPFRNLLLTTVETFDLR